MRHSAILLLFIIFISCNKDAPAPDLGYNYFPDQTGHFVIYNVDSLYYDDINHVTDTFRFQLKEKIQSQFADNSGRPALRLERYIKAYDPAVPYNAMPWQLRNVWTENRLARTAEKVEENVRFVKLAFPVKAGQVWDGNAQNTLGRKDYSYLFFDQARIIGGMRFDSVLQVEQEDVLNAFEKRFYIEKYARNTGLVYKQVIDISSQEPAGWAGLPYESDSLAAYIAIPIMNRITSGFQYTMTILSSGTE